MNISEFETFANRISDFPPSFYLSCFISGLKPHIRCEITALQPTNLPQAIALAKLQDDKSKPTPTTSPRFFRPPSTSPTSSTMPTPKPLLPLLPTPPTKLPIRRLSEAETQARRDKTFVSIAMSDILEVIVANLNSSYLLVSTLKTHRRNNPSMSPFLNHTNQRQASLAFMRSQTSGVLALFGSQGP